jgi:hypothetical protein
MALMSSIATQNAARNTIADVYIIEIDDVEFSGEVVRRWKHSIGAAAKNVPTKISGAPGLNGHIYLVETDAAFNKISGVNPTPATNLGALNYTTVVAVDTQSTTMAQDRTTRWIIKCFTPKRALPSGSVR